MSFILLHGRRMQHALHAGRRPSSFQNMVMAQPPGIATTDTGIDLAALTTWMNARHLGHGPIEATWLLPGGTQNILLRFTRGGRDYVLRRPPTALRANSNETMRREACVLTALAGTPVPHPALVAACGDEDVLGAAFYLMAPVEGFNAANGLPALHAGSPAVRRRMGLAMVEAIAALGMIDHRAVGLAHFGKPDNYLERQVARWRAQLASYAGLPGWHGPAALPGVERVARWLEAHRPGSLRPGILHGDFHLANVMFRHDGAELGRPPRRKPGPRPSARSRAPGRRRARCASPRAARRPSSWSSH